MGLSIRNGWLDEQKRVFIYFTLEEAMGAMGCGHNKAVALFTELDKVGLIERKKQARPPHQNLCQKLHSEGGKSRLPKSGSLHFLKREVLDFLKSETIITVKIILKSMYRPSYYPTAGHGR